MASQGATGEPERVSGAIRVLWVGDGRGVAELAEDLSAFHEDFEVLQKADPGAALEAIQDGAVDCIVSDHRSAGLDGLEFLEQVRSCRPELPFVLVPTDGDENVASRAIEADVSGYVPGDDTDAVDRLATTIRKHVPRDVDALDDGRTPIRGRTLTEEIRLKERALDEAPVGITIADTNRPDAPLIYTNDSFVEVTGYETDEVLGTNCRFLQGPGTDAETVAEIREAVEAGDPVSVDLRNYRRDGTEFWNRLELTPIEERDGEVTCYAGFQQDITELKRVQADLEEERSVLADILGRIDELVSDVSELLIQAETESEIARTITSRLTDGKYGFAWLGQFDPSRDAVAVVEAAGDGAAPDDRIDLTADRSFVATLGEAIESGDTRILRDADALADSATATEEAWEACAIVPITYRNVAYGALAIFSDDPAAFEHETTILSALGCIVGSAINAIRSKRTALTGTTIQVAAEIEGETFLEDLVAAADAVEFENLLDQREDVWSLLFTVEGADLNRIEAVADDAPTVQDVDVLVEHGDHAVLQFFTEDMRLLDLTTDHGVRLTDIDAGKAGIHVRYEAGDEDVARSTLNAFRDAYEAVDLAEYHESERAEQTAHGFRSAVENRLTDRQLAALRKAHAAGFFEWPRQVEGDELAESMGIVASTFHQHLRAAERKVLDELFE
ncbi:MAG: helix-turn-helix domain-containing protein [Halobacteriales archaeon]